ncbi:MAG: hypothetical protein WBN93_04040 [Acidimicrobiia bacterium]
MTAAAVLQHASFSGEVAVVQSSHVPPGRRFEPSREAALHPHMYEIAQTLGDEQTDLIAVPEFAGPYGIADLAVVATAWSRLAARIDAQIEPIVHELDAAIVAHLTTRRGRALHELTQVLPVRENEIDRRIAHLVRVGAVQRSGSGRLTRHESLSPLGRIYAIELKVRAWRRAIDQARAYALWSDRSIAVLGSLPADRSNVMGEARAAGVGLAVESEWLVRPRATGQPQARRLWTSEIFFAAISRSQP